MQTNQYVPSLDGTTQPRKYRLRNLETHTTTRTYLPIDIHVARVAKDIGLLPQHTHINWDAAVYLTQQLKKFNATDPVKYDIALFSLGVMGKM